MTGPGRGAATLVAALLLTTGCAVLTIDVDVYKGPLANDEAVQVEQAAVMAIGAKPLLIQLRDTLELNYPTRETPRFRTLENLRSQSWYRPRYVAQVRTTSGSPDGFQSDQASRINAVLSLYEDAGDRVLLRYLDIARQAAEEYDAAVRTFSPSGADADFVKSFPPLGPSLLKAPAGKLLAKTDPKECAAEATLLELLRRAYVELIAPSATKSSSESLVLLAVRHDAAREIVQIHRCLLQVATTPGTTALLASVNPMIGGKALRSYEPGGPADHQLRPSTVFGLLAQTGLAEAHAALLLQPLSEQARFSARVRTIASAWGDGHAALSKGWRAMLEAVMLIDAQNATYLAGEARALQAFAQVLAELSEPLPLLLVLEDPEVPASLLPVKSELVRQGLLTPGKRPQPRPNKSDEAAIRRVLESALFRSPGVVARGLADADRIFASPTFGAGRKDLRRYDTEAERAAGIVSPESGLRDLSHLRDWVAQARTNAAGGLEGGRLSDGLETLIVKYLEQARKADGSRDALDQQKRDLYRGLVGFAQKTLSLVNLSGLVDDGDAGEQAFLLQAIGNSILTQVDELERARSGQKFREVRGNIEALIRDSKWGRIRPGANSSVSTEKDQRGGFIEPKLELDEAIAELRYRYLKAVADGPASRDDAERLSRALREAFDLRSRMIALRPAAAFLRNSYPVTSLQRDSSVTWRNLLQDHTARQIFGAPEGRAGVKAIQEFDKQFWQNVNTVRVAGAGVTNYVVAKDDVGNWYVKNFSSNPETIIKGAKSLALFAAGGSLSADAVNRASDKIRTGDATPGSPEGSDAGATRLLQDQREAATQKDLGETQALAAEIRSVRTTALAARVDDAWKAAGVTDPVQRQLLGVALDSARTECEASTAATPATPASPPTVAELQRLKTCRDAIEARLNANRLNADIRSLALPITEAGARIDARATEVGASLPVTELGTIKTKAGEAVTVTDSADQEARRAVAEAAAPATARAAVERAKSHLGNATTALTGAQPQLAAAAGATEAVVTKLTEANDAASRADDTAKKTKLMTTVVADVVTASRQASRAAAELAPATKRLEADMAQAVAALAKAAAAVDAAGRAYSASPVDPTAAAQAITAQGLVAAALKSVSALQEAATAAEQRASAIRQPAVELARTAKTIVKPPTVVDDSVTSARTATITTLSRLIVDFSQRREGIARDHAARLKAILGE